MGTHPSSAAALSIFNLKLLTKYTFVLDYLYLYDEETKMNISPVDPLAVELSERVSIHRLCNALWPPTGALSEQADLLSRYGDLRDAPNVDADAIAAALSAKATNNDEAAYVIIEWATRNDDDKAYALCALLESGGATMLHRLTTTISAGDTDQLNTLIEQGRRLWEYFLKHNDYPTESKQS